MFETKQIFKNKNNEREIYIYRERKKDKIKDVYGQFSVLV